MKSIGLKAHLILQKKHVRIQVLYAIYRNRE